MIHELKFLTEHTGQDETALLARALRLGVDELYRQAMEQAFIDEAVTREDALSTLGRQRVEELEYAMLALKQDVAYGLALHSA